MLSIEEWRRRIIVQLSAGKIPVFRSEMALREIFDKNLDGNFLPALQSLSADKLIWDLGPSTPYYLNASKDKEDEIQRILSSETPRKDTLNIEYEKEFSDCFFWFSTNGDHKSKGNYLYFKSKSDDMCFKVIVKMKNKKATRINLGCISDMDSKIGRVMMAIKNIEKDEFLKSDVEKLIPHGIGNNRQPVKAAFDILEKLDVIQIIDTGARHPKYRRIVSKVEQIQNNPN